MPTLITHEPTRKAVSHLRSRILGAGMVDPRWYLAADALEFALEKHDGMLRKDGVTPYILHPVQTANYVLTLPSLSKPLIAVCGALTHDTMEDCGVTYQQLVDALNAEVADATEVMTKKTADSVKTDEAYDKGLANHEVGSILKPCDRFTNQGSMYGVFSIEKAVKTVNGTEARILPLLKHARRKFPHQEQAYENLKCALQVQISLVRAIAQGWPQPSV